MCRRVGTGLNSLSPILMENLEYINRKLIDEYGIDTVTGRPIFRVVWANDQLEKRLVEYLDSGLHLLHPEVKEVKKYPYLKDLYVLERLVVVPDINEKELPVSKLSYEPIWAYRDADGVPLPPIWTPTKFVVDTLYAAMGKSSLRKYIEPESETTAEGLDERIVKLQEELFGNETDVGDALAYKEGIVVPQTYKKDN